ncbi:hypothetical protein P154DRAFT_558567 [Amniculicola lignicola CBS 123094]|uniref:DUF7730 domain-containing protein n=1 Tax=Amniculicola lignicola CBS 123094 TaxID=1392246 RepID=A0A6A5WZK7_9PLEO|nr:hypothetical protein P154DRAFT_558567 [Amniculicola lignicola CBS 123094]
MPFNILTPLLRAFSPPSQTPLSPSPPSAPPAPAPPLPTLHPSNLPPAAITGYGEVYARQAQSLLISKLPIELRALIWEHFLGGHLIHMYWQTGGTPLSFICKREESCISLAHSTPTRQGSTEISWTSIHPIDTSRIDQKKGFMPLLLTCRALYFESTRALYTKNTFDFSNQWAHLRTLQWHIPLISLTHITSLTMKCHGVPLPSRRDQFLDWKLAWEAIALLKGLKYLRVELVAQPTKTGDREAEAKAMEAEEELLKPVRSVSAVRDFEIAVPWPEREGGGRVEGLRCRIVRV